MAQEIMWARGQGEPGLEHLRVAEVATGSLANGTVIGIQDNTPFSIHYTVVCDPQWQVQATTVRRLGGPNPPFVGLLSDRAGHWTTFAGDALPALDGCLDVDITATPFTNTLPIADEKRFDKMTVLSIAPLLARAIREVFEDGSVTSMFDDAKH